MWVFFIPLVYGITIVTSPWVPLVNCTLGSSDRSAFSGYYIDLVNKIAKSLEWYESEWTFTCMSYEDMISAVESGTADIAVGCISITNARLKTLKFSTPTLDSGLVLLTINNSPSLFWLVFMPFDYTLWLSIMILIVVHSHLIWMAEQHQDGPIQIHYSAGILEALHHSLLSLLLLGDLKLRTLTGFAVQIAYWIMGVIIIAAYLSNISAILSIDWLSSDIESYKNITDSKVGGFADYEVELKLYSSNVVTYEWTFEASQLMVRDLHNGKIQAAVLPYTSAIYLSQSNCDFLVVGERFIIDYYAFAFSLEVDNILYQNVTQQNLELYLTNYHRNLENKFAFVTTTGTCDYSVDIPLGLSSMGGLWSVLIIIAVFGVFWVFIYKRHERHIDEIFEDKTMVIKNKDLRRAAEIDLQSKFESILRSSEDKLIQKIKDFQVAMKINAMASLEFKEALAGFGEKLKST